MSDRISSEYKNAFDKIEPRAEFLQSLEETLDKEIADRKRSKIKSAKNIGIMTAAAASIVLVLGAAIIIPTLAGINFNPENPGSISESSIGDNSKNDNDNTNDVSDDFNNYYANSSAVTKPLEIEDWNTENLSPTECAELLADMLSGDGLSYCKISDTNVFTSAEQISDAEIENIAGLLRNAEETDETGDNSAKSFYMAVFNNDIVVKFTVSESGVISIPAKNITLKTN